ncbi:hypothetical protein AG1IA_07989 [Rhizoctonia solani AG-1 IA]|uniref:Uncharacterized protein n=1 Tax=Thanatephorus cucumeris (strain AG1-IA) TaxID=983506 RepID=L8WJ73_THACA|nr:hypothetical protein AG1IA_07989 [Rhizoctonia solani AG-1 IA]
MIFTSQWIAERLHRLPVCIARGYVFPWACDRSLSSLFRLGLKMETVMCVYGCMACSYI